MKTQTKIKIVSIALIMLAFSFTMSQEIDSAHKEPLKKSAQNYVATYFGGSANESS